MATCVVRDVVEAVCRCRCCHRTPRGRLGAHRRRAASARLRRPSPFRGRGHTVSSSRTGRALRRGEHRLGRRRGSGSLVEVAWLWMPSSVVCSAPRSPRLPQQRSAPGGAGATAAARAGLRRRQCGRWWPGAGRRPVGCLTVGSSGSTFGPWASRGRGPIGSSFAGPGDPLLPYARSCLRVCRHSFTESFLLLGCADPVCCIAALRPAEGFLLFLGRKALNL